MDATSTNQQSSGGSLVHDCFTNIMWLEYCSLELGILCHPPSWSQIGIPTRTSSALRKICSHTFRRVLWVSNLGGHGNVGPSGSEFNANGRTNVHQLVHMLGVYICHITRSIIWGTPKQHGKEPRGTFHCCGQGPLVSSAKRWDTESIKNNCQSYLVGGFNPSEKYESQVGSSSQLSGKIKIHVPNHQPVYLK